MKLSKREIAKRIVLDYFKDDRGRPFVLTDGQADIFNAILFKEHQRVQIIAPTQYGKSNTIAMALILRSQCFSENFAIVTGQEKKSQIIMEKVIQHTFDDKRLYVQLEVDKAEGLERLKRERSRQRITWKCGGEIRVYTADSRNRRRVIDALTGLGSPNIIEDEASLIPDDLQAMVLRMLGGYGGGFLLKIGNPFTTGHFRKTWQSMKYQKIFIDYKQGMAEGRYTEEFIEEMREQPFFEILYACKFPEQSAIDLEGYYPILKDSEVEAAIGKAEPKGIWKMGVDIGEGGDETVAVIRCDSFAKVVYKAKIEDLMASAKVVDDCLKRYKIQAENCFVDDTGVGAGVVDRLHEIGIDVQGIKWAESPTLEMFKNRKAENYWNARTWIIQGGKLEENDGWREFHDIKYREDTGGKLKIKSKEDMRKAGIPSPNVADAFALTFNESDVPHIFIV